MKTRIMYLENKATGEARIGRVTFSRTLQTVYYQGKALQRSGRAGLTGNFFDVATKEEYWVSGPKKRGGGRAPGPASNRCHRCGRERGVLDHHSRAPINIQPHWFK